jgi:hypothetical protein
MRPVPNPSARPTAAEFPAGVHPNAQTARPYGHRDQEQEIGLEGGSTGIGVPGFWLFIAVAVVAGIWEDVRKREFRQETLRPRSQ